MVVKSVFTAISLCKTKIGAQNVVQKFQIQKGGTNFSILGWGKNRGEPKLFQNPTGNQSLTHYALIFVFFCIGKQFEALLHCRTHV